MTVLEMVQGETREGTLYDLSEFGKHRDVARISEREKVQAKMNLRKGHAGFLG
jgi:hypothetical protein